MFSKFRKSIYLTLSVFVLVACSSNENSGSVVEEQSTPNCVADSSVLELKGAKAKQLCLTNNLKVTLLSSPTSDKSAMAVAVKVGHFDNPVDAQGLAHYLEHTLFLGTEEYPVVDGYKQFLSRNGGGSNAYTSTNHTNYYLEVNSEKFEEAAHRLSRFFVSPIFDEDYVEREKNAVENEFNFRFEAFKPNRVFKSFYKEELDARLFSIGNLATLGDVPVEETIRFYKEHYYAEAMHATLTGPQSLEELEALARTYLSDIESRPERPLNQHDVSQYYDLEKLPAEVSMKSSDGVTRELTVVVPTTEPLENDDLNQGLTLLIGDESEDSLMYQLQQKNWAKPGEHKLSGGVYEGSFSVTVELTELGAKESSQVLNHIYGYFEFLKSQPMPSYLLEEVKADRDLARLTNYYSVDGDTAQNLNRVYFNDDDLPQSVEELFFGDKVQEFTKEDYTNYLSRLNWDKALIIQKDPGFTNYETDLAPLANLELGGLKLIEKDDKKLLTDTIYNFGYEYVTPQIEDVTVAKGNYTLKKANPFYPSDNLEVFENEDTSEYQKRQGRWGKIFYTPLEESETVRTFLSLDIYSQGLDYNSTKEVAALFLYREWLRDQVTYSKYPMLTAGFTFGHGISILDGGMSLEFSGWSDKFLSAFDTYLSYTQGDISRESFETIKDKYTTVIQEERASDQGGFATRETLSKLSKMYLNYEDLFQGLESLSYEDFSGFKEKYNSKLYVSGALSGNVKPEYVENISEILESRWNVQWADTPDYNLKVLRKEAFESEEAQTYTYEGPTPQTSYVNGVWNLGELESKKEERLLDIFGRWFAPDYYTELRTNQGLAYSLGASTFDYQGLGVLRYILISSSHTAKETGEISQSYLRQWTSEILPKKSEELLAQTINTIQYEGVNIPAAPEKAHAKYLQISKDGYESMEAYLEDLQSYNEVELNEVVDFVQKRVLESPFNGVIVEVEKRSTN